MSEQEHIENFRHQLWLLRSNPEIMADFLLYVVEAGKIRHRLAKSLKKLGLSGERRTELNNILQGFMPDYKDYLMAIDPTCRLCLYPIKNRREATIDHIVPISKGGAKGIVNQQLAHARCNVIKGNREIESLIEYDYSQVTA